MISRCRKIAIRTLLAGAMVFNFAAPSLAQTLEGAIADYREGDVMAARKDWQDLAEAGSADALFNLGQIFRFGYGVDMDLDEATLYLTQASSMGHTPAQRELGNLYFFDIGTPDLKRTAINLWQTAARNGDGRAQYTLGVLFFTGDMVPRNQSLGFAWTLLATEAGVPEAMQLQTAMQAQLSKSDLQKGLALSSTLMTGTGGNPNYAVLVGEQPQLPRPTAPVAQTAEATIEEHTEEEIPLEVTPEPEPALAEPVAVAQKQEPEPEDNETTNVEPTPTPAETKVAEALAVSDVVQSRLEDNPPVENAPETETAVFAETEPEAAQLPALSSANDEFDETRQVLAGLIEETSQETGAEKLPEPQPILVAETTVERDLGDPNSPLVDQAGFGNDWSLQLTSFRKPENAEAHWQDMMRDYAGLFTGLEKRILRFDLGPDKGIYYRLRVGPFASKETADQKCAELTESALGCLVIWP